MKKIILNIIIAIALIGITSIVWNIPKIKYDLNRDGKIDLVDVMEETKHYLGGRIDNNYDVNNDGEINSKDLLDLRKYLIENGG